jgi:hypothetical protein
MSVRSVKRSLKSSDDTLSCEREGQSLGVARTVRQPRRGRPAAPEESTSMRAFPRSDSPARTSARQAPRRRAPLADLLSTAGAGTPFPQCCRCQKSGTQRLAVFARRARLLPSPARAQAGQGALVSGRVLVEGSTRRAGTTCLSQAGFQSGSKRMSLEAPTRLMPHPPALLLNRNANCPHHRNQCNPQNTRNQAISSPVLFPTTSRAEARSRARAETLCHSTAGFG